MFTNYIANNRFNFLTFELGVLVVNVTWRGKTYVGTLLDVAKHDWAAPRFCDSPSYSDLESKGLLRSGKRSRGSISETENSIKLPQSKLRNGKGRRNLSNSTAREEHPQDQQQPANNSSNLKRVSGTTPATTNSPNQAKSQQSSPVLIRCPEPTCNKRYRHINGLKYHQAHHPHHQNENNTSKSSSSSANKIGEQSESNKESEETTDTEDYSDNKEVASTKLQSKSNKLMGKYGKSNKEERNKSPFSDISDDIENESRPSSMNGVQADPATNLSEKREEISAVNRPNSVDKLSKMNDACGNLKPVINNDEQKTNEELRKLASEVDLKINKNVIQSPVTDKPLLNASVNHAPSNSSSAKPNSIFPPNLTMDPALHAFLMQTDLSYRLNYERFLLENQEKLLSHLPPIEVNSLNELEKERYKSCFLTSSPTVFNGFKLPGNNHLPISSAPSISSATSVSGGSIVNGTSNQSQNKNAPSPYDFMEYEKQMEKQREDMFRLSNSFKMEEQRLLNSKAQLATSNIKLSGSHQIENQLNGSNKVLRSEEGNKFSSFSSPQTAPSTAFTIPTTIGLPSSKANMHQLPFDPTFLNRNSHFSPSLLNGLQQSAFLNPLDSLRFASAGLSQIDLNSANNSSKLMTTASQQVSQLINSKNQINGLHRPQGTLNQNSSPSLNASNNSESKDENRSPPPRNPLVGFPTVLDPYGGELTFPFLV